MLRLNGDRKHLEEEPFRTNISVEELLKRKENIQGSNETETSTAGSKRKLREVVEEESEDGKGKGRAGGPRKKKKESMTNCARGGERGDDPAFGRRSAELAGSKRK